MTRWYPHTAPDACPTPPKTEIKVKWSRNGVETNPILASEVSPHHWTDGSICAYTVVRTHIDLTQPVQTRDGRPARVLCIDRARAEYLVVALVTEPDGAEDIVVYTTKGDYYNSGLPSEYDLVNVP